MILSIFYLLSILNMFFLKTCFGQFTVVLFERELCHPSLNQEFHVCFNFDTPEANCCARNVDDRWGSCSLDVSLAADRDMGRYELQGTEANARGTNPDRAPSTDPRCGRNIGLPDARCYDTETATGNYFPTQYRYSVQGCRLQRRGSNKSRPRPKPKQKPGLKFGGTRLVGVSGPISKRVENEPVELTGLISNGTTYTISRNSTEFEELAKITDKTERSKFFKAHGKKNALSEQQKKQILK